MDLEYKLLNAQREVLKKGAGRTLNLSSGGILFECEGGLPIGATVRLSLTWPVPLNNQVGLNLCVMGRTVRSFGRYTAVEIVSHEFKTRPLSVRSHAGSVASMTASAMTARPASA